MVGYNRPRIGFLIALPEKMMKIKKVNDALLCIWKIARTSYQFVRLHPNGSGTAAFFLSLYLVCPFGFKFLTYTIATIYGVAIIVKIIANSEPYDLHGANLHALKNREFPSLKSDSVEGVSFPRKHKKPTICAQMSKRRNFKIRIEDLETLDDDAEGKQASFFRFDDNQINGVVNDPDNLVDRNAKVKQRDDGMSTEKGFVARRGASSCKGESVAGKCAMTLNEYELICDFADEPKQRKEGSQSQSEANDSSEEPEDEDEEDAPGDRSQGVEWTEEDQQSLMDLGLSELERNKRLENLIAKRTLQKATSLKIQENLLDLDISHSGSVPPVNISKNPFVPPHLSGDALESHLPGSAPSVLLPERNPFDLPYDSNEEKPNLTVDGISPEILAPHPKDILSRHESFFYGPSFTAGIGEDSGPANSSRLSLSEKRNLREPRYSRFRQQSDKDQEDGLAEQVLSKIADPKSRPDASKNDYQNDETTNLIRDDLKVSLDEQVNEQYREDASIGDETEKESTSSTSEDQKDADAESSTYDENIDRQIGFRPEGHEEEEFSKGNGNNRNSNSMNNPFGSFISLMELDKEDSLQRQQGRLAGSPESSRDVDLEVRKATFDDPSNGNKFEAQDLGLENHSILPTSNEAHRKQDKVVNKEG